MADPSRRVVAIAGASGFIGSHLLPLLSRDFHVVALARSPPSPAAANVEWRACDLFSATSTQAALAGADLAIYLVHSMMPSSRLFQGDFRDTDLLLADNFAKACLRAGVQQIVYLGGLVPRSGFVSHHLQSRVEVEGVMQSSGIPVTCLRAGMIVGPGGSSFEILRALVMRLPWMILPKWTRSAGQAVFLDDVLAVLQASLVEPAFRGRTFDLVNGESLSYEELLRQTAAALGKKPRMAAVPIASTGFSKRWIQLFSNASYELISPLVDSLQCDLPAMQPAPEIAKYIRYPSFASMVVETLRRTGARPSARTQVKAPRIRRTSVRSIQRLPSMPDHDSHFISNEYMSWLPQFFRAFIRVERVPGTPRILFRLAFVSTPLLVLEFIEGADRARDKFHIVGGLLTKTTTTGWLEFRQIAHRRYTLSAIHEFVPALPWLIYIFTQAPMHARVMRYFGRHLQRLNLHT